MKHGVIYSSLIVLVGCGLLFIWFVLLTGVVWSDPYISVNARPYFQGLCFFMNTVATLFYMGAVFMKHDK